MDILRIINNGYNPYFIKGFGGLSYHPDRNIQGGTVTTNLKKYSPSSQTFVIELEDPETGNVETVTNETDQQIAIPLLLAQLHNGERDKEDIEHVDKVVKLMADANIKRLSENELKVSEDIGRQIAELGKLIKKSKTKDTDLVGSRKALKYIDTTNEAINKAIQAYRERKHIPTEDIILSTSKLIKEHGDSKRSLIKKVEGNIKRYNKNLVNGKPTSYNKEIIVDSSKKLISLYSKEMSMYSKLEQQTKIQQLINKYEGYIKKYSPQPKLKIEGKKYEHKPERERSKPQISKELLEQALIPLEAPEGYETLVDSFNKYLANPLDLFKAGELSHTYASKKIPLKGPDGEIVKYKKSGEGYKKGDIMYAEELHPLIAQFYSEEGEEYGPGKDLEDKFLRVAEAMEFIKENMTSQLTEETVKQVSREDIVLTDAEWLKEGVQYKKEGDYFMFDAIVKYFNDRGKLMDMLFIEFKKYIMNKYNNYNNLETMAKNCDDDFMRFYYITRHKIEKLFKDLRDGRKTKKVLDNELGMYFTDGKIDINKLNYEFIKTYNYEGIPVKYTKFLKLDDSNLDDKYPVNSKKDADYIKRISGRQNLHYLQELDKDGYLTGLDRNSDKEDIRKEYNDIVKKRLIKPGEKGDLVIIIGVKDAILVCNYSQKIRDKLINRNPFNSLQLAKTAYQGETFDHYKIPIWWFESIPLN